MARRPNYGGEKRQKEIKRQQKREAKEEKKRLRREGGGEADGVESRDVGLDAGEDGSDPEPVAEA